MMTLRNTAFTAFVATAQTPALGVGVASGPEQLNTISKDAGGGFRGVAAVAQRRSQDLDSVSLLEFHGEGSVDEYTDLVLGFGYERIDDEKRNCPTYANNIGFNGFSIDTKSWVFDYYNPALVIEQREGDASKRIKEAMLEDHEEKDGHGQNVMEGNGVTLTQEEKTDKKWEFRRSHPRKITLPTVGVKGGFGKLRVCIDEGELDVMLRYSTGNTFSNNLNPYALHTGMKYDCFLQLGSAFETGHQYSGPRVCHGEDATRCKVVTLAAAMNRKEFGVEIQELDIAFDKAHVNPGSNQKLSCAGNRTAQTFKVDKIEAVDAQSQKSKAAGMFEVTMDQIMYQRSHVSFTLNYEIDRVVDATGQMFKLTKDSER